MNSRPNQPSDASQSPSRDPAPAQRQGPGAVEAKLKEAQANLMDAEGKLMASNATAPPPANDAPHRPYANATTETPMSARTPVGEHAAQQPPREKQPQAPAVPPTERLPENVAGMLCYLFGWVSGLVFLLFDRRPFVRFHAAQSVAVFATLSIVLLALSDFFLGAISPRLAAPLGIVSHVIDLVWLVAAVVLMLKAAAGERYHVKIASQYADRAAHGAK